MNGGSLIFDAVAEPQASAKWRARWERSWPDYRAWFLARGGESGPSRAEAEAALARYMPELVPVHRRLTRIAGGGDLAARFLATWCPPRYLGGCSVAAVTGEGGTRLLRNYDLAPELNEGLLLRSEWTGRPVMGMVEFLWGLSDGVNGAGLAAALAYGGHPETAEGFGVTTLMRYVLETCGSVPEAIAALRRIPSHMAYNVTLADRTGRPPQILGYSMGGAVGLILACRTPDIARFVGLAPWIPDQLDLAPLDGRRIDVIHGSLDGWLPLIPGVSVASSRRGVARAREAGADAHHTVIRGAIHAVAFDGPGDLLIPAPRAGRWRDLARNALAPRSDALRPRATPPGADARDAHRWAP